ncbi:hypothetical protein Taro_041424 [Colocasia esculenta]|uniref:Uncharacterized protein n=1 Tax=Colocasia esculenta TaxID=4460 RepID=A0A843WLG4_COLES|nr:hypothetical protein [Colocasia esculenta]
MEMGEGTTVMMEMGEGARVRVDKEVAAVVGWYSQRSSAMVTIAPKMSIMAPQCSTIEGRSFYQPESSDTSYSSGYSGYAMIGYPASYFYPPPSIPVQIYAPLEDVKMASLRVVHPYCEMWDHYVREFRTRYNTTMSRVSLSLVATQITTCRPVAFWCECDATPCRILVAIGWLSPSCLVFPVGCGRSRVVTRTSNCERNNALVVTQLATVSLSPSNLSRDRLGVTFRQRVTGDLFGVSFLYDSVFLSPVLFLAQFYTSRSPSARHLWLVRLHNSTLRGGLRRRGRMSSSGSIWGSGENVPSSKLRSGRDPFVASSSPSHIMSSSDRQPLETVNQSRAASPAQEVEEVEFSGSVETEEANATTKKSKAREEKVLQEAKNACQAAEDALHRLKEGCDQEIELVWDAIVKAFLKSNFTEPPKMPIMEGGGVATVVKPTGETLAATQGTEEEVVVVVGQA